MQLALHLLALVDSLDLRLLMPHMVAWTHDLLLLSLTVICYRVAISRLPSSLQSRTELVILPIVAIVFLPLSLYPQMLREYLSFPVNIFSATPASMSALLTNYLGLSRIVPLLAASAALLMAMLMPPIPTIWYERLKRPLSVLWAVGIVTGLLTIPRSPHPVVNSLKEELSTAFSHERREVPALHPPTKRQDAAILANSSAKSMKGTLRIDHVYLIVLEGVSADQFEKTFSAKGSVFFNRIVKHARYFDRYYTTNLDSYTSLIAMLTSEQVPYRSYTDTSIYENVNSAPNLVRSFNAAGFHTQFISTYDDQPFIPVRKEWSSIMHRKDLPIGKTWVSVESSRMESATEDRAALSTIAALPRQHQRTFTLHELAYGHTTEWRAKTGIPQLAYYDTYLNELLDLLMGERTWKKSLLVIVSDHGDRAGAENTRNYRVPLLIVGPGVEAGRDHALRSHLDLQHIIASMLSTSKMPKPREDAILVGSTERWIYGLINADGNHIMIDDHTGKVVASRGGINPLTLHDRFQKIINDFSSRFDS
ncbi:sulfatase-like hydrolase/transferase [Pelodictyon luteolum]|nr:sulfatase-like hydrolase/transferase [Pelodictyon luteolum]